MHTRFELLLHGPDAVALRAAGEAALNEVERLEDQLSIFRPASEISGVNRLAADRPVRVSPPVFRLLQSAQELSRLSEGAFDPTVAPLMRCWGFLGGTGHLPSSEEIRTARATVGMHWVELGPDEFTVRFRRRGMMLDLGAIGKGYAIDCAAEVLKEAGVVSAFLHSGTSSCFAIGSPPDVPVWRTAIPDPRPGCCGEPDPSRAGHGILAEIDLRDGALGVSGIHGKCFHQDGRAFGHVLNPRSGAPPAWAILAAVCLPSAMESDALSTALLALGQEGLAVVSKVRPRAQLFLVSSRSGTDELRIERVGLEGAEAVG